MFRVRAASFSTLSAARRGESKQLGRLCAGHKQHQEQEQQQQQHAEKTGGGDVKVNLLAGNCTSRSLLLVYMLRSRKEFIFSGWCSVFCLLFLSASALDATTPTPEFICWRTECSVQHSSERHTHTHRWARPATNRTCVCVYILGFLKWYIHIK